MNEVLLQYFIIAVIISTSIFSFATLVFSIIFLRIGIEKRKENNSTLQKLLSEFESQKKIVREALKNSEDLNKYNKPRH